METVLMTAGVALLFYTPFVVFFALRYRSLYVGLTCGPAFLVKILTRIYSAWEWKHP